MQRAKAPTAEVTIDRYYCLSWKDLEAREDDAVREMENGRFFFFFMSKQSCQATSWAELPLLIRDSITPAAFKLR